MKIIVGLGNPGTKYQATKHNIGFMTVDEICAQQGCAFNKEQNEAVIAEFFIGTEKTLLVKPQTFMNDSGRSIRPLMDYYNIALEDLLVIYDDMDLEVGAIRLRAKGSAGGHNGIKSLIAHLGTQAFNRLRIGIDRPRANQTVVTHVLSTFPKSEHELVLSSIKKAADATLFWAQGNTFENTMNQYNRKGG